jgi:tRNA (guanine-N7-)-methyltransferase
MPHILLEHHDNINIDSTLKEVESNFTFIAKSKYDQKIGVVLDGKEFLLTKVDKKGNDLIKLDDPTRLSPVTLMKKALNDYAKISECEVLFTNTHSLKNKVEPEQEYLKSIEYFATEFKTDKEIYVEVGFGSGTHLLHQAVQNPDKLVIGLEIHTPSIEQVLKQAKLQNITNILVVNYDARLFLEFLDSNSVGRIFVHFPVPWDKKPHRRVMSVEFINESMRVLKPEGTLELRTDSPRYFAYSYSLMKYFKEYNYTLKENQDLEVVSKYEARWKRQEKTIWDLTIKSKDNSLKQILEGDFSFDIEYNTDSIRNNLSKKAILKNDYLVRFETVYEIESKNGLDLLIKVTLGSFNKPVTKFIIIQNNKARYFQGAPIKTKSNLMAHQLIKKSLK